MSSYTATGRIVLGTKLGFGMTGYRLINGVPVGLAKASRRLSEVVGRRGRNTRIFNASVCHGYSGTFTACHASCGVPLNIIGDGCAVMRGGSTFGFFSSTVNGGSTV